MVRRECRGKKEVKGERREWRENAVERKGEEIDKGRRDN